MAKRRRKMPILKKLLIYRAPLATLLLLGLSFVAYKIGLFGTPICVDNHSSHLLRNVTLTNGQRRFALPDTLPRSVSRGRARWGEGSLVLRFTVEGKPHRFGPMGYVSGGISGPVRMTVHTDLASEMSNAACP